MNGPPPKRRPPRHLQETVPEKALTSALASKIRREVALESAEKEAESAGGDDDGRETEDKVVVVLGPDGVPQIADDVDSAPTTVRVDVEDEPEPQNTRRR
ncbi:MAG: hypothetical protein ACLQBL_34605 [Polyangiaceae bacterium]|jgi:hypothetical protein